MTIFGKRPLPIRIQKHCRMTAASEDGTRVLTMRFWPRGCVKDQFDEWQQHLAPSKGLLRWCRANKDGAIDPEVYESTWKAQYREEMAAQADLISDLRKRHEDGETLTLLCACHDIETCHRSVLADLILEAPDTPDNLSKNPE